MAVIGGGSISCIGGDDVIYCASIISCGRLSDLRIQGEIIMKLLNESTCNACSAALEPFQCKCRGTTG